MRQINYKRRCFLLYIRPGRGAFFITVGKVRPLSVALVGKPVIIYQLNSTSYHLAFTYCFNLDNDNSLTLKHNSLTLKKMGAPIIEIRTV